MSGRPGRVALGVVTFVVLGAGWFALVAPRSDGVGSGSTISPVPSSIWPEGPFDPADALSVEQSRVDAGQDRWRLRADAVVAHFVRSTFGWITIEIADAAEPPTAGPVTYRAREDCGPLCEEPGGGGWVAVTVDRLLGDQAGTIWSVVAVRSERLRLPVEAGDIVVAGESLPFGLSLAEDRHAAVGVRYAQPSGETIAQCGDGFAGEAGVTEADVSVTVPDPPFDEPSCSAGGAVGYVFAYTTTRLTVQTGDPFVEPVYLTDLSIVPVVIA